MPAFRVFWYIANITNYRYIPRHHTWNDLHRQESNGEQVKEMRPLLLQSDQPQMSDSAGSEFPVGAMFQIIQIRAGTSHR